MSLCSDGNGAWWVASEGGRGAIASNPGLIRLGGGLIMRFCRNITGVTNSTADASVAFTFPVRFRKGQAYGVALSATDEATGRNNVTANAQQVTDAFASMAVKVPGGTTGTLCAIGGFVIGE